MELKALGLAVAMIAPGCAHTKDSRLVEEVAERVKTCGDFGIEKFIVDDPDKDDPNTETVILTGVPQDPTVIQCIIRESIGGGLPGICIPELKGNGADDNVTFIVHCRDRDKK